MINISDLNLKFIHKETRLLVFGKSVTTHDFVIYDPVVGLRTPITKAKLKRIYDSHEDNFKMRTVKMFKRKVSA